MFKYCDWEKTAKKSVSVFIISPLPLLHHMHNTLDNIDILWWLLDHLHPLLPHLKHGLERVQHLYFLVEVVNDELVNCNVSSCPPNTSTAVNNNRSIWKYLYLSVFMYIVFFKPDWISTNSLVLLTRSRSMLVSSGAVKSNHLVVWSWDTSDVVPFGRIILIVLKSKLEY